MVGGGTRAFAYDLDDPVAGMWSLGTLGGGSRATAIDWPIVVGEAGTVGGETHAFADDLNGDVPEMVDLGRGDDGSVALAVSGDLVVGFNRSGLAAWRLNRASMTVRFARPTYVVEESIGRERIALVRSGDLGPSVTLDVATLTGLPWYARRRAVPGVDFVAIEDEVTFASGQGRAAFTVPVVDDHAREDYEGFLLSIASDDDQLAISVPSLSGVVIDISDQQPDTVISTQRERGYQGNNVYNTTGAGQTKVQDAPRGARRSFFVHLLNDGKRVVAITTHANPAAPGARIRYFLGGKDVTPALRSPQGLTRYVLNSGGDMADYWPHPVPFRLRVQIEVRAGAPVGSLQTARISAAWHGDHVNRDVVRARVLVTP